MNYDETDDSRSYSEEKHPTEHLTCKYCGARGKYTPIYWRTSVCKYCALRRGSDK